MLGVIDIGLDPVLVRLGPLSVHWYGLMYVVGILAGIAVTVPYAARRGIDSDSYYAVFWPVVICALIGGRLYYVVQSNFGWYLQHPARILATWEGGMAFYGAVFGGLLAAYLATRWRGLPFLVALDVAALFAPIAQTFGRVGNIVNGDIIGYPSTLPWATRYTNPANTFVPSHTLAYQPAAAYELVFSAALFYLLYRLRFRLSPPGTLFALWLVLYSIGQFLLFFGRANIVVLFGLKQAQLTSIAVVAVAVPVWLWYRRRGTSETESGDVSGGSHPIDAPSAS
jgi:phosphatidylglycerol---prolipoprotein diacylglyceryl transferase